MLANWSRFLSLGQPVLEPGPLASRRPRMVVRSVLGSATSSAWKAETSKDVSNIWFLFSGWARLKGWHVPKQPGDLLPTTLRLSSQALLVKITSARACATRRFVASGRASSRSRYCSVSGGTAPLGKRMTETLRPKGSRTPANSRAMLSKANSCAERLSSSALPPSFHSSSPRWDLAFLNRFAFRAGAGAEGKNFNLAFCWGHLQSIKQQANEHRVIGPQAAVGKDTMTAEPIGRLNCCQRAEDRARHCSPCRRLPG